MVSRNFLSLNNISRETFLRYSCARRHLRRETTSYKRKRGETIRNTAAPKEAYLDGVHVRDDEVAGAGGAHARHGKVFDQLAPKCAGADEEHARLGEQALELPA